MPSDNIPYPIFNYSAMVAWTYFATVIAASGSSVVSDGNLITKVYFPRLILPLAPALSAPTYTIACKAKPKPRTYQDD